MAKSLCFKQGQLKEAIIRLPEEPEITPASFVLVVKCPHNKLEVTK